MTDQRQFAFQLQFGAEAPTEREAAIKDVTAIIEKCGGTEMQRIWVEQDPGGSYTNVNTVIGKPTEFWHSAKPKFIQMPNISRIMIAMCEGDKGWDNYLLLHHFDDTQELDDLP